MGSKVCPPGDARSKPINTARGTLERRRTCGLKDNRTAASAETAVPLRCRERLEPVGPLDPRRPARPRTFPRRRIGRTTRANARCENDGGCLKTESVMSARERRAHFPSPLEGEGARAEAKPSECGRGVIFVGSFLRKRTPHPARARYRSALATLSLKGLTWAQMLQCESMDVALRFVCCAAIRLHRVILA